MKRTRHSAAQIIAKLRVRPTGGSPDKSAKDLLRYRDSAIKKPRHILRIKRLLATLNRAYERWEARGRAHGNDLKDWLEARDELLQG